MLKLVKIAAKFKMEYLSRSSEIVLILLVEGKNDLGTVNVGYEEDSFPELNDLAVDTS